ncbi:SH3 domain-containing protein [Shimia gijangensis]|uniref:SH3 domain-containing protein n=1 Tax=Shimia gijangensis TaxID=1470563 RepID=A0A1M6MCF7_9RHOB|nr:SH3 domain-containing protein [Shimia gijangensis]SHJ81115.1 SH3 domain-containing protein [Shimia gijangensis]
MKRFILLSFIFLGWGFYEFSGGAEFEPEPPARLARYEAEKVARDDAARKSEAAHKKAVAEAAKSQKSKPADVQLVSLDVSNTQSVLTGATNPNGATFIPVAPRKTLFSAPSPTPQGEVALISHPATEIADESVEEVAKAKVDLRKVRSARVNMRNGPGTQYSVLGKLKRGDQVTILQEPGNGWVKLKVVEGGRIGWISASLLAKVD